MVHSSPPDFALLRPVRFSTVFFFLRLPPLLWFSSKKNREGGHFLHLHLFFGWLLLFSIAVFVAAVFVIALLISVSAAASPPRTAPLVLVDSAIA